MNDCSTRPRQEFRRTHFSDRRDDVGSKPSCHLAADAEYPNATRDGTTSQSECGPAPTISAIIVSYNTREMTLQCLGALQSELHDTPGITSEIWLVDNASADGSVEAVRLAFPDVRVIANGDNVGFGAANNQAMARAGGDFFLLLNSDAFPQAGAVRAQIAGLKANPDAGVAGPRLLNGDGSLQRSCYRFPTPLRAWLENLWIAALLPHHPHVGDYARWEHDRVRRVDFVIGACLLVRRAVYAQVGGFDPAFFMYSEETDWQRRMARAGWQVVFTPDACVTHLGGASGSGDRPRINRHFFESLDTYEVKHHGLAGLIALRAAMTLGCGLRCLLWAGVGVAFPARRAQAWAKSRFAFWLCARQATHWDVGRLNALRAHPMWDRLGEGGGGQATTEAANTKAATTKGQTLKPETANTKAHTMETVKPETFEQQTRGAGTRP